MANNVVRFIIRGRDLSHLRSFYGAVFGWQFYDVVPEYLSLETYPHDHDDLGNDIGPPVVLDTKHGALLWRYESEAGDGRVFVAGIPEGGLGTGDPGVVVFVEVDDIEKSLAAVADHGGSAMGTPVEIPEYARVAQFKDPEGNVLACNSPFAALNFHHQKPLRQRRKMSPWRGGRPLSRQRQWAIHQTLTTSRTTPDSSARAWPSLR